MILDKRNEFCDATALNTGAAGATAYTIGSQIDLLGLGSGVTIIGDSVVARPASGDPLYLVIGVDTTFVGASMTQTFQLVSDSVATLDSSPTIHWQSGAIPVASCTAGSILAVVPMPAGNYERYLGIRHISGTAAASAGKINAFLTDKPGDWYPATDNVN